MEHADRSDSEDKDNASSDHLAKESDLKSVDGLSKIESSASDAINLKPVDNKEVMGKDSAGVLPTSEPQKYSDESDNQDDDIHLRWDDDLDDDVDDEGKTEIDDILPSPSKKEINVSNDSNVVDDVFKDFDVIPNTDDNAPIDNIIEELKDSINKSDIEKCTNKESVTILNESEKQFNVLSKSDDNYEPVEKIHEELKDSINESDIEKSTNKDSVTIPNESEKQFNISSKTDVNNATIESKNEEFKVSINESDIEKCTNNDSVTIPESEKQVIVENRNDKDEITNIQGIEDLNKEEMSINNNSSIVPNESDQQHIVIEDGDDAIGKPHLKQIKDLDKQEMCTNKDVIVANGSDQQQVVNEEGNSAIEKSNMPQSMEIEENPDKILINEAKEDEDSIKFVDNDTERMDIDENTQRTDIKDEQEQILINVARDVEQSQIEETTVAITDPISIDITKEVEQSQMNDSNVSADDVLELSDTEREEIISISNTSNNTKDKSKKHGLRQPDMMLEIPTEPEIMCLDGDDDEFDMENMKMSPTFEITDDSQDVKMVDLSETAKDGAPTESDKPKNIDIAATDETKHDSNDDVVGKEVCNEIMEIKGSKAVSLEKTDVEAKNKQDITVLNEERKQSDIEKEQTIPEIADSNKEVLPVEKKDMKQDCTSEIEKDKQVENVQPSTSSHSEMMQDASGEVPESDSLGLLAESSRVMEDEDDQEDEEDGDDDDDFDPEDESSNQMTAEHSEDSNAHQSETEVKETADASAKETDVSVKEGFSFTGDDAVERKSEADRTATGCDIVENIAKAKPTAETQKDSKTADDQTVPDKPATQSETVRVSDTSDNDEATAKKDEKVQKHLSLTDEDPPSKVASVANQSKQSPSKTRNLTIARPKDVLNFVEIEESSSEEDILEVNKPSENKPEDASELPRDVSKDGRPEKETTEKINETEPPVNVLEEATSKSSPQPPPTEHVAPPVVPETKPSPWGLEVFTLDSDDEDVPAAPQVPPTQTEQREALRCVNSACKNTSTQYYAADINTISYFDGDKKRATMVCEDCTEIVANRNRELIEGIRSMMPLLDLDPRKPSQDLVEISDSDSEDEADAGDLFKETIGESGAKLLEGQLADMFNETWVKYNLDARLADTESVLKAELDALEKRSKEINTLLNDCQVSTDSLRKDLYATFQHEIQELPPVILYDSTDYYSSSTAVEKIDEMPTGKRRMTSASEPPAKKAAIPLGYTPLDTGNGNNESKSMVIDDRIDDDSPEAEVAVVKLSAEAAPADLPAAGGELARPPLQAGALLYAMSATGPWHRVRVTDVQPKPAYGQRYTMCTVEFKNKAGKNQTKILAAKCLAYAEPANVRMTIGTRAIAWFKDPVTSKEYYSSGIVAEVPNPVNMYRYLIFFDHGYAQYARHGHTRLVCECSPAVWEEVDPNSREFVRKYLLAYPERPMVRLHAGQNLKTEWKGRWWASKVLAVDASLAKVQFLHCPRVEWIYRGSTRLAPLYLELQAAERHRPRALPRIQGLSRTNMPYVEYTRSDESSKNTETQQQRNEQDLHRQRAVAKKSVSSSQVAIPSSLPAAAGSLDNVTSRVVYYTPKNAVRPHKMVPHSCSAVCKRTDVLPLKELRTYNPLAKPLLSGWERQIVRYKGQREVIYRAPCGRRLRNMPELHRYLRAVQSDMPVDLFDFSPATHCLAEFVINKCLVSKKDLSHGKENVPVPCVNYYDESLPEFCSYNTERTPTAGVPLNLDPDFLCGCDCQDDCEDKSKCACWKMTLEGARTIGIDGAHVGYRYRRLPDPLPSGIYECNSRCKCKHTCLNRVAQHPLQLKLQVFKTLNRGWGIRALNDVPKGAFLCVYAGNLLTDATANLDGLNEGDEYLAELDYIEVVEQMKEGYEEDIPDSIKNLDKKEVEKLQEEEDDSEPSSEEEQPKSKTEEDHDFRPGYIGLGVAAFSKRLRKRDKKKEKNGKKKEGNAEDECITISDDDEQREPSRFAAADGMGANQFVSKYSSVRTLFGEDEACYIMDAKVQGNIGRYLNHSCCPNVFVQNVFVDTHDPRFPWVAFFALSYIRAGTELTWNYNYDVGSVPGKVLYCYCGADTCRGRLL